MENKLTKIILAIIVTVFCLGYMALYIADNEYNAFDNRISHVDNSTAKK